MPSPPRNLPRIPRSHSYSHPEPHFPHHRYANHLEWARIDLQTALLAHSPPELSPKLPKSPSKLHHLLRPHSTPPPYGSYDDYHYVEAVPNLELHSAAAEGNVGLVHYALTHGQPINSILHGLQPIHAAAAGGSLSALRMLIDRGADVNAPRLPRRYSSEKNKDAPSVGVAGATPLHFAAANGHAQVVQLLLTNGAISDKADQMGQTPEGLAEENGHGGVLDVLRVYDSLRRPGSSRAASAAASASDAMSIHSSHASAGGPSRPASPSGSTRDRDVETVSVTSRKGKERAHSLAGSEHTSLAKMKKSIGGFLGRRSRKSSLVMSPYPDQGPQRPSIDETPGETLENRHPPRLAVEGADDDPGNASHSPFVSSPASSHRTLEEPTHGPVVGTTVPEDEPYSAPPVMSSALARTASTGSHDSHNSLLRTPPPILAPPRERKASHSSRRPSLPSIFEKAVHPGQAFRAAMRNHKTGHENEDLGVHDESIQGESHVEAEPSSNGGNKGFFVRGRQKASESHTSKRYTSGLIGLFRRPHSPPSRSPSPPMRGLAGNYPSQVDPDELNKEIERLRTAQSEAERERQMERRHSYDEGDDGSLVPSDFAPRMPKSAPATKTRFFENLDPPSTAIPEEAPPAGIRKPNRSRTGSEVIAPSPLANEWPRESSDSDSTHPGRVRRVKTDGSKHASPTPSRLSGIVPPGQRMTKPRSATLPSSPAGYKSPLRTASGSKLVGMDWDEAADLRSGVLIRESVKKREEGELSPIPVPTSPYTEEDDGEEVYHDASDMPVEVVGDAETPRSPTAQSVRVEDPVDGTIELASPPKPARRFRGASIGSVNSTSSRLSAPGSSVRFSGGSDDGSSDRHARFQDGLKMPPPPVPHFPSGSSVVSDGRPRGKSVSSIGTTTTTSGSGYQYSHPVSTPGTSLTPPSTISITLSGGGKGGFPPVPENGVAAYSRDGQTGATSPTTGPGAGMMRTVSTRQEVEEFVRQAGDGVLHIAQMPESSESSRDLAAQLAAFGESVAMQEEMDRQERRERRERRRMYRAISDKRSEGQEGDGASAGTGVQGDDVSVSSRSTQRTPSMLSTNMSMGMSQSGRSESFVSAQSAVSGPSRPGSSIRDAPPIPILVNVEAPKSSVPGINSIYDRRAALYRENMAKLSAAQNPPRPAALGSSGRHHSGGHRPSRYTASEAQAHINAPRGAPAWLTGATPAVNLETGSRYSSASIPGRSSAGASGAAGTGNVNLKAAIGSSVRSRSGSSSTGAQYRPNNRPDLDIISSSLPQNSLPLALPLSSPDSPRRLSHKSPRKAVHRSSVAAGDVQVQPLILTRQSVARIDTAHAHGNAVGRAVISPTGSRAVSGPMSSGSGASVGGAGSGNGNGRTEEVAVIPAQSASYTLPGPSGKGRSLSGGASTGANKAQGSSTAANPPAAAAAGHGSANTASATHGHRHSSNPSPHPPVPSSSNTYPATPAHNYPSIHPLKSTAPAISIFNHRFTGPHDGGDSDDSSELSRAGLPGTGTGAGMSGATGGGIGKSTLGPGATGGGPGAGAGYMVIENDWRGGGGGGQVQGPEGEGKRKWGLKGLKGRKS